MIPVWVVYIVGGVVLGIIIKSLFNRTPAHDQGFSITRFSTPEVLEQVASALDGLCTAATQPRLRLDSQHVLRVIYRGGKVMNWTDEHLQERIDVDSAHAFVVSEPRGAADAVVARLRNVGIKARVIANFDESVKPGTMMMVVIEGERTALIFRRHVVRMGGPRPVRYIPSRG